jgi:hypothetical protein
VAGRPTHQTPGAARRLVRHGGALPRPGAEPARRRAPRG